MLARPLGFAPRPLDKVVPPVRPADVEVHQDPGHRELRERIHVCKCQRPEDLCAQDGRESRQNRQTEVEYEKENGRGYDESSLSSDQILERLCPFYAHPLVLSLHRAPFPRSSVGLFTILQLLYTVKHTRQAGRGLSPLSTVKSPRCRSGGSHRLALFTPPVLSLRHRPLVRLFRTVGLRR